MSSVSGNSDNESDFLHPSRRLGMGYDFSDKKGADQVKISTSSHSNTHTVRIDTLSLLETCAQYIGQNLPFEVVQLHSERVPEELQMKIAYWSFPLDEERLLDYAKMMKVDNAKISRIRRIFDKDLRESTADHDSEDIGSLYYLDSHARKDRIQSDVITKVTQIGMYLFGSVANLEHDYYSQMHRYEDKQHSVCVQFDRRCITSTMCSCGSSSKWCEHVIVLCLARIRGAVPCDLHPPLSETLAHFDRDQLQKMVQHFVQKLPLLGVPPVMEIAGELKKKESEISKQCGAPDLTAGGNFGENARWQIDESIIESQLHRKLDDLMHSDKTACLEDFEHFRLFLQSHDENVVTVLKWILKQMGKKSGNESSDTDDFVHTFHYSNSRTDGLSPKTRSQLCLAFIQGIQVFFVDPFISKSCKEEVIYLLQSEEAYTEPTTDVHSRVLVEAVCVGIECPQPTRQHLRNLLFALQRSSGKNSILRDSESDSQLKDDHLNNFYSLVAILSYCLFHRNLPIYSEADSSVIFNICESIFLPSPQVPTFGEIIRISSMLEAVPIATILRHGLALIECLIKSKSDQKQVTEFAAKLFGASSVHMQDAIVTGTEENFLAIIQIEEAILGQVKKYISTRNDVFPPALCHMLKEYLCSGPKDSVFSWSWNLLRLAAIDSSMIEDVRKIVETLISNSQSILYHSSLTESVYQAVVVDAVRDSFQSLLGHLLQNLPHDSAQLLFTALSDALPFPLSKSLENYNSHKRHVNQVADSILYGHESHDLSKERPSVLPFCDPLWHPQIQASEEFQQADAAVQSDLLSAVTAMICVNEEHIVFIEHLGEIIEKDNYSLYFQLQLLYLRVSACDEGYHSYGYDITQSFCQLQLGTPDGQLAFHYLLSNWKYCLEPLQVFDLVVETHAPSIAEDSHNCKEEISQLITDAISSRSGEIMLVLIYSQRLKNVIQILSSHNNPEHLVNLVDVFDANAASAEDLEHLARAVGGMLKKVMGQLPIEIGINADTCSRLKATCVKVLSYLVACITKPEEKHYYNDIVHPSMLIKHRPRNRLQSLDIHEWASIVRIVGEDAIKNFLEVLQVLHQVKSLRKFSYSFCQDLGILWMEYSQTLPTSSHGILNLAAFKDTLALLITEKEENARNYIQTHRESAEEVKEALLLVASIYQPLHLEKNFASFVFDMSQGCSVEVQQMIEQQFMHISLSDLEIPENMHKHLSQLDALGNARHEVGEEDHNIDNEASTLPDEEDSPLVQQFLLMQHAARMRDEYMSTLFGFGEYHDEWDDY